MAAYISIPSNAGLIVAVCTSVMVEIFISVIASTTRGCTNPRVFNSPKFVISPSAASPTSTSSVSTADAASWSRVDTLNALDSEGTTDVLRSGAETADMRETRSLEEEGAAIRNMDEIVAGPRLVRFNMMQMVDDYKGVSSNAGKLLV